MSNLQRALFLNKTEDKQLETKLGNYKSLRDKNLSDLQKKADLLSNRNREKSFTRQNNSLPSIDEGTSLTSKDQPRRPRSYSTGQYNQQGTIARDKSNQDIKRDSDNFRILNSEPARRRAETLDTTNPRITTSSNTKYR